MSAARRKSAAAETSEAARRLFAQPCEFVGGAGEFAALPKARLPEAALVGRSNAGKSSLINALTGRRALARVSDTPGRTREINFFRLGNRLMLVDLPGYGYARAPKEMARQWQDLIVSYLRGRAMLRRVCLLIDARRGLMPADREAIELFDAAGASFLAVLTKADKVKANLLETVLAETQAEIARHAAAYPEVLATSAVDRRGIGALQAHLAALAAR